MPSRFARLSSVSASRAPRERPRDVARGERHRRPAGPLELDRALRVVAQVRRRGRAGPCPSRAAARPRSGRAGSSSRRTRSRRRRSRRGSSAAARAPPAGSRAGPRCPAASSSAATGSSATTSRSRSAMPSRRARPRVLGSRAPRTSSIDTRSSGGTNAARRTVATATPSAALARFHAKDASSGTAAPVAGSPLSAGGRFSPPPPRVTAASSRRALSSSRSAVRRSSRAVSSSRRALSPCCRAAARSSPAVSRSWRAVSRSRDRASRSRRSPCELGLELACARDQRRVGRCGGSGLQPLHLTAHGALEPRGLTPEVAQHRFDPRRGRAEQPRPDGQPRERDRFPEPGTRGSRDAAQDQQPRVLLAPPWHDHVVADPDARDLFAAQHGRPSEAVRIVLGEPREGLLDPERERTGAEGRYEPKARGSSRVPNGGEHRRRGRPALDEFEESRGHAGSPRRGSRAPGPRAQPPPAKAALPAAPARRSRQRAYHRRPPTAL